MPHHRLALMSAVALTAASLVTLSPISAQPTATAPASPASATQPAAFVGDEQGAAILDAALAHLETLDTLAVEIALKMHVEAPGMVQDMDTTTTVALAAPNQLAIRAANEDPMSQASADAVSDGETLWTYASVFNRYTQEPAPAALADWEPGQAMSMNPTGIFIPALTNPTAVREALAGLGSSIVGYVGAEQLDGEAVHRLRVGVSEDMLAVIGDEGAPAGLSVDVWVSAGDVPWVRKVVPDMEGMFDAAGDEMPQHMKDMTFDTAITFNGWASPDTFPQDTFAFVAPEGAELVDDFFAEPEMADAPNDAEEEEDAEALVGQAAPAFALPTLAGDEQVALADLQGKIVVLDFWATWCPPCVKGLPKVSAAAAALADQGVVFFALNQQEDAQTVNAFLKAKKLEHLAVLMDDGDAAQAYRVSGIPQTVIIDRAGVVRAVHVGFGPGGERQVTADIQAILATDATDTD